MGQYHTTVNLTKKEFISPHKIGNGLKLMEQVGWEGATSNALFLLLACSNGRGGGDAADHPMAGRWAGDEIAVIGDYAEADDLKNHDAKEIYDSLDDDSLHQQYTDISTDVWDMMVECLDLVEHVKEAIK